MKSNFYDSREWQELRYKVLKHYGPICQLCGNHGKGVIIQVDHIKPRSKFPDLELEFTNLQILCQPCNGGKSNIDETDWRPQPIRPKLIPGKLIEFMSKHNKIKPTEIKDDR